MHPIGAVGLVSLLLTAARVDADPPVRRPPLYIVSMMHAEDRPWYMHDQSRYEAHAGALRDLASVFADHGAKLAFQPDWTFVKGTQQWDPELFTWLLDQGMGVDAHTHAKQGWTLESVADLIAGTGVPDVRIGNGDFDKTTLVGTNMFWAFSQPQKDTGEPYFDAICAYKDSRTGEVDRAGIVWRPRQTGDWHVHDPETPVLYIGGGPIGALKSFAQLREQIQYRLKTVKQGYINVMYWHDPLAKYGQPQQAAQRIAGWEHFLGQEIDPLVASNRARWATFTEIADDYLALEASGASELGPGDAIPLLMGPAKIGDVDMAAP